MREGRREGKGTQSEGEGEERKGGEAEGLSHGVSWQDCRAGSQAASLPTDVQRKPPTLAVTTRCGLCRKDQPAHVTFLSSLGHIPVDTSQSYMPFPGRHTAPCGAPSDCTPHSPEAKVTVPQGRRGGPGLWPWARGGLTLKSRFSDVDLPCEMPAAITEPEWIIGPSWKAQTACSGGQPTPTAPGQG